MTTQELNQNKPLSAWLLKAGEEFELDGKKYIVIKSDAASCACCSASFEFDPSQRLCAQAPICNSGNRSLVGGDNVHFVQHGKESVEARR
jgi:Zn finger protein HypA/HybF involved in hydrogenase expression